MFTCICGKEFKTKQALSGHQGYCEKYLGEDRYLQNIKNNKNAQLKAKQTLINNAKIKKQKELNQWILEQHTCEKCGKVMTKKYASGRFCSKECARGFSNYKCKNKIIFENGVTCPYCNKGLKDEFSLKYHLGSKHKLEENERKLNSNVILNNHVKLNITNKELIKYKEEHTYCEICGKSIDTIKNESNRFKSLCIDHNHSTNEFRGLLCLTCNSALGWFEKNELAIINYLAIKGKQYGNII